MFITYMCNFIGVAIFTKIFVSNGLICENVNFVKIWTMWKCELCKNVENVKYVKYVQMWTMLKCVVHMWYMCY